MTIHDGGNSTSPLLGKACGNSNTDRDFISTGNIMYIQFETDLTTQKKGFIAEYVRFKNRKGKSKKYKIKRNS